MDLQYTTPATTWSSSKKIWPVSDTSRARVCPIDPLVMRSYGANTYRFSLAWTRIIPDGGRDDPINEQGVDFYNAVIDECLRLGMTPFVTLFQYVPTPSKQVSGTSLLNCVAGIYRRPSISDTEVSWTRKRSPRTLCDMRNYVTSDSEIESSIG